MRTLLPLLLIAPFALASGCAPYYPPPPSVNYPPRVEWARSACYWDSYNGDYIWWFEAWASDPNGWQDVDQVWADVYDVGRASPVLVDSFELYGYRHGETNQVNAWFSDWLQWSTALSCGYRWYEVDVIAYDRLGEYDVITIIPGY